MGKAVSYSKVFVVGRKHKRVIHRELVSDPLPDPTVDKSAVEPKTRGHKREQKLQRYLMSGLVQRSDKSAEDLLVVKTTPSLVFTAADCLDEAELRAQFPKRGIGHNFFMGKHKFVFLLAADNIAVAQIHKAPL